MKKWILGVLMIIVLFVAGIYLFIPSQIEVSAAAKIGVSENGAARFILHKESWPRWWNTKDSSSTAIFKQSADHFIVGNDTLSLMKLFHMSADVEIKTANRALETRLLLVAMKIDTTGFQWHHTIYAGNNPFARISRYQEAKALKKTMDLVLNHMRSFLEKPENVYGVTLLRTSIKDTLLISSRAEFATVPNTSMIYNEVKTLIAYAEKNGAIQTGSPIYHVTQTDNNHYDIMTALPINKILPGNSRFSFKRMVPGSFIVTDIKGGEYAVEQGQKSLDQFFADYRKTSMAINFRMLVTDRMKITDSTQWITRLYQPVY
jgi:hypothetical protein